MTKKNAPKKKPPRGYVAWSRDTFDKLIASPPEMLASVFDVNHVVRRHGMIRDKLLDRRRTITLRARGIEERAAGFGFARHRNAGHQRIRCLENHQSG